VALRASTTVARTAALTAARTTDAAARDD
jgi:hypothetical protein